MKIRFVHTEITSVYAVTIADYSVLLQSSDILHKQNKTFVITGGASGLGAAFVELFLSKGAKGIAVLDIAEDVGKATAERLNKIYDDKVTFIKCDVSKEEEIVRAFDAILALFKQIDVVINKAGIMNDSPRMWRTSCDVNWQGSVSFTLKSIKHMRKDKEGAGGTIINISSTAALRKFPYVPTCNGCKMAVLHFSQCISMEPFYENTNIRVLTMCFGCTDTPILQNVEAKCYDPDDGNIFVEILSNISFQKVESAVAAFIHMFENGGPGTTWLSVDNKPVKDITATINRVYEELNRALVSD